MGGSWQLVFVCCLLVQSLSAEDSVRGNSTSVVNDNSGSAVNNNSTSAVNNNSTSAVNNNSTSVVNDNSISAAKKDEELEKEMAQRMASMREMERDEIRGFADLAVEYFNSREASVFTTLEDATVTVKKAIGSMMYMRMTVEKTNCTKKDIKHQRMYHFSRFSDDAEKEEPPKHCGPLAGEDKEQLECKFDLFRNERSYGEAVVNHECKPVRVIDRSFLLDDHRK